MFTPSSLHRRHHRHHRYLLSCGRLPLRPLPRRALVAGGGRQLPSDQERLSGGILDVLWSWTDGTPQCYGTACRSSGNVMFVPGWTLMIKLVYCITKKAGLSDEE